MNKVELTPEEYYALQDERAPYNQHLGTPVMDKLSSGGVNPNSINLWIEVDEGNRLFTLSIKE